MLLGRLACLLHVRMLATVVLISKHAEQVQEGQVNPSTHNFKAEILLYIHPSLSLSLALSLSSYTHKYIQWNLR